MIFCLQEFSLLSIVVISSGKCTLCLDVKWFFSSILGINKSLASSNQWVWETNSESFIWVVEEDFTWETCQEWVMETEALLTLWLNRCLCAWLVNSSRHLTVNHLDWFTCAVNYNNNKSSGEFLKEFVILKFGSFGGSIFQSKGSHNIILFL